jgi:hypothetical protein
VDAPQTVTRRGYGNGAIHWGGALSPKNPPLYPPYELTAAVLKGMGIVEDFAATGPVRYGHRRTNERDIYFVSNRTGDPVKADCRFRVNQGRPQLWDPVTGEVRNLPVFERKEGVTSIPMEFDAYQSFFVVFGKVGTDLRAVRLEGGNGSPGDQPPSLNFPDLKAAQELNGAWEVAFDPKWGKPEKITFETLQDWTNHSDPRIKYYSGIATYRQIFDLTESQISNFKSQIFLDLGTVHDMARVKLNGKDLGVVWCAPWRVDITGALKAGENRLEIEVVNRWPNRMIGDKQPAEAGARRYTFSTHDPYGADSPLLPSGLLGPVRVLAQTPD